MGCIWLSSKICKIVGDSKYPARCLEAQCFSCRGALIAPGRASLGLPLHPYFGCLLHRKAFVGSNASGWNLPDRRRPWCSLGICGTSLGNMRPYKIPLTLQPGFCFHPAGWFRTAIRLEGLHAAAQRFHPHTFPRRSTHGLSCS